MPEQDQTTGADWSEDAPAAGQPASAPEQATDNTQAPVPVPEQPAAEQPAPAPEPPAPVLEEPAKPALPPNPVASLRQVFRDVAAIVGGDKAAFILAEFYGVADPDALRAADLLAAIDKLYEAA